MTTLSEINNTLLKQNKNLEEVAEDSRSTSENIQVLVNRISEQTERSERQRLKETKKPLPPKPVATGNMAKTIKEKYDGGADGFLGGLLKGLGLGAIGAGGLGIAAFVGGILSKVLGLIGKGTGKLLKTGVLIGLVSAFGEDVINALFGDKLTAEQKADMKTALYASATWIGLGGKLLTGLIAGVVSFLFPEASKKTGGMLVDGFKGALDKIGLSSDWIDTAMGEHAGIIQQTIGAMAIAMAGRAILLFGGKKILRLLTRRIMTGVGLTAAVKLALDKLLPAGGTAPAGGPTPAATRPTGTRANPARQPRAASRAAAKAAAQAAAMLEKGKGYEKYGMMKKAGRLADVGTGKFKSVDDLVDAILAEKAGKAARYAKFLKFAGPLGAFMNVTDPLMAIYTDQPEDVIKKELAGALGGISGATLGGIAGVAGVTAIPVIGQTGFANILGGIGGMVAGSLAGEYTAEALASYILGGPVPKPIDKETQITARASSSRPMGEKAVRIQPGYETNALDALSADRAKSAAPSVPPSIPSVMMPKPQSMIKRPSMTDAEAISDLSAFLMKSDYENQNTAGAGGPSVIDASNNSTSSVNNSHGLVMPMNLPVDMLDVMI